MKWNEVMSTALAVGGMLTFGFMLSRTKGLETDRFSAEANTIIPELLMPFQLSMLVTTSDNLPNPQSNAFSLNKTAGIHTPLFVVPEEDVEAYNEAVGLLQGWWMWDTDNEKKKENWKKVFAPFVERYDCECPSSGYEATKVVPKMEDYPDPTWPDVPNRPTLNRWIGEQEWANILGEMIGSVDLHSSDNNWQSTLFGEKIDYIPSEKMLRYKDSKIQHPAEGAKRIMWGRMLRYVDSEAGVAPFPYGMSNWQERNSNELYRGKESGHYAQYPSYFRTLKEEYEMIHGWSSEYEPKKNPHHLTGGKGPQLQTFIRYYYAQQSPNVKWVVDTHEKSADVWEETYHVGDDTLPPTIRKNYREAIRKGQEGGTDENKGKPGYEKYVGLSKKEIADTIWSITGRKRGGEQYAERPRPLDDPQPSITEYFEKRWALIMEVVQAIIPHYRKIEREAQHILFQAWIQDEEAVLEWFRHYEEIDEVYTPPKPTGAFNRPTTYGPKHTGRKLVEEWLGAGRMNALAVGELNALRIVRENTIAEAKKIYDSDLVDAKDMKVNMEKDAKKQKDATVDKAYQQFKDNFATYGKLIAKYK
jgi:hypothetical protein